MELSKLSIPLCAIALAACGGGGGGGETEDAATQLKADAAELRAFAGDVKSLNVTAFDASGRTVTAPSLTWTSTNEAVASVEKGSPATSATVTTRNVGDAKVIAREDGLSVEVGLKVFAAPTLVDDLKQVFPYENDALSGRVLTYSDVSKADNDALREHMLSLFTHVVSGDSLLPKEGAPLNRAEFFVTRDNNVLLRGQPLCDVPAFESPPSIGAIMFCPKQTAIDRWFLIGGPNASLAESKAKFQEALAAAFFTRAIEQRREELLFTWLYKGVSLYFEAGVWDGKKFEASVEGLKARMAIDPATRFVRQEGDPSATTMIKATYSGTDKNAPVHAYSYAPAALVLFLEEKAPGTVKQLMADMVSVPRDPPVLPKIDTNDKVLAALRVLTPYKTDAALDAAYKAWLDEKFPRP